MTAPEPQGPRPGLRDIVSAFFAAEHAAETGQVWPGPCDRAEPDLRHDYDGPELHPGTPEYAAGYAEYLAAEAAAVYLETRPVSYTLTPQAEALLAEPREPEPETELERDSSEPEPEVEI
jgi:hypothetical protein